MHDFLIGYLSNVIPTYIFYPMDTLMVRFQTGARCRKHLFSGVHRVSHLNGIFNGIITMVYFGNDAETPFSNLCGGMVSGLLFHPIENRKIYVQTHTTTHSCLVRGLPISVGRELIGVPVYFHSYRIFKQKFEDPSSVWCHYICGGLAGVHSWLWSYPLSTIRANYILHQKINFQLSFLYKGFGMCAARSFFINGTCFALREKLSDLD